MNANNIDWDKVARGFAIKYGREITAKQAREIFDAVYEEILADVPNEVRDEFAEKYGFKSESDPATHSTRSVESLAANMTGAASAYGHGGPAVDTDRDIHGRTHKSKEEDKDEAERDMFGRNKRSH